MRTEKSFHYQTANLSRYELKEKERKQSFQLIKKLTSTPKKYLIVIFIMLGIIGSLHPQPAQGVPNLFLCIITAIFIDLFMALKQKRKRLGLEGGILTAFIVAFVLSPAVSWYIPVATTAIAITSKHVIKNKRKPIFNPAAVGLLVATSIFASGESWWGGLTLLPAWTIVFLLLAGYLVVDKVNKSPLVLAFLGTYFTLLLIFGWMQIGDVTDALRVPIINSALFLAFFMATDPPTSPAKYRDQIWFGMIAAIISIAIYLAFGGLSYLLIGLLAANGLKAWKEMRKHH